MLFLLLLLFLLNFFEMLHNKALKIAILKPKQTNKKKKTAIFASRWVNYLLNYYYFQLSTVFVLTFMSDWVLKTLSYTMIYTMVPLLLNVLQKSLKLLEA